MRIKQFAHQPVSLVALPAQMGHFAIPVWDKTQFGVRGLHSGFRIERLFQP